MGGTRAVTARTTEEYIELYTTALREQREKSEVLHEARIKAWNEMRDAQTQHQFLADACRHTDAQVSEYTHRLTEFCKRQALELSQ